VMRLGISPLKLRHLIQIEGAELRNLDLLE